MNFFSTKSIHECIHEYSYEVFEFVFELTVFHCIRIRIRSNLKYSYSYSITQLLYSPHLWYVLLLLPFEVLLRETSVKLNWGRKKISNEVRDRINRF